MSFLKNGLPYLLGEMLDTKLEKPEIKTLTDVEIAEVFAEVANKTIKFKLNRRDCDIYHKIDRNPEPYFHYWVFNQGRMYKIGSGGYIPDLHPLEEKLFEFRMKTFDEQLSLLN